MSPLASDSYPPVTLPGSGAFWRWIQRGGRDYVRPFLAWTAPGVLKVTVAKAPMRVMALDFDGVHVDLRVDPDDPVIKAAVAEWRRSVGLPPEPERKDGAH